MSSYFIIF